MGADSSWAFSQTGIATSGFELAMQQGASPFPIAPCRTGRQTEDYANLLRRHTAVEAVLDYLSQAWRHFGEGIEGAVEIDDTTGLPSGRISFTSAEESRYRQPATSARIGHKGELVPKADFGTNIRSNQRIEGKSRAERSDSRSILLCEPSQNGAFLEAPQPHRAMRDRPPSPKGLPSASTMSTSPLTWYGPTAVILMLT